MKPLHLALVGVAFANQACKPSQHAARLPVQVYYIPIGAQTLVGVTSDDIERKGREYEIKSQEEIDRIEKILDSAGPPSPSEAFSNMAVRVKLVEKTPQGTKVLAVVENEGFVKRANGQGGVLDSRNLAALKKLIEAHLR